MTTGAGRGLEAEAGVTGSGALRTGVSLAQGARRAERAVRSAFPYAQSL